MTTTELINLLTRDHLLKAVQAADSGGSNGFKKSTTYDVVHEGRAYPPKKLVGLALEVMTGDSFSPNAFVGGADRACFRALERCGFTVVKKAASSN